MRSRVIPGSSPTIDRRLPVILLKSVLLPTLGRPTIATSGSDAASVLTGTTDLRYVGKISLPAPPAAAGPTSSKQSRVSISLGPPRNRPFSILWVIKSREHHPRFRPTQWPGSLGPGLADRNNYPGVHPCRGRSM